MQVSRLPVLKRCLKSKSELIKKAAKKSFPLDPMPPSVVLEVLDVLFTCDYEHD